MPSLISYTKAAIDAALALKAAVGHTHSTSDVTGLDGILTLKAASSHQHPASDITTGVVSPPRLGTGTPSTATFLRGDGSWQVPSSSGIPGTIVDAKGDLIVATAADTVTRLPVGTNGFILKADSTNANGMVWAADLSMSVNWFDAKGDLIVGAANNASVTIPVGSNGQVLTADSAQSGGVKWSSPVSGGFKYIDPEVNQYVRSPKALPGQTRLGTASGAPSTAKVFIPVNSAYTISEVVMRVSTAGAGGSTVPVRIYAADGTGGRAGTLLATVSGCATGSPGIGIVTTFTGVVVSPPGFWADFGAFTDTNTQVQWLRAPQPGNNLNTSSGQILNDVAVPENGNGSLWLWVPDLAFKRSA